MRLDKLLVELGIGSRSELKKIIKSGAITVNGARVTRPEMQVNPAIDEIIHNGNTLIYEEFEYYLLNKPAGYVSATKDNVYPTVMELIPSDRKGLAPVGRLDVDTEGLLLITNDGQLSHQMLSPKKHVDKTYYAQIEGIVTNTDVDKFASGLDIGDDKPALPGELVILSANSDSNTSEIQLTISEGRFHQVKRMFEAVGKHVTYLKRISFGPLTLPDDLPLGEYIKINKPLYLYRR